MNGHIDYARIGRRRLVWSTGCSPLLSWELASGVDVPAQRARSYQTDVSPAPMPSLARYNAAHPITWAFRRALLNNSLWRVEQPGQGPQDYSSSQIGVERLAW